MTEQRYKEAILWLDKIFPFLPDYQYFSFTDKKILDLAFPDKEDWSKAYSFSQEMTSLMVDKLKYAETHRQTSYKINLNDEGRYVKSLGGITKYYQQITASKQKKDFAEKLELEKLVLEVNRIREEMTDFNKTRNLARSAKNWSVGASVSTILTLILLLIQWICSKPS